VQAAKGKQIDSGEYCTISNTLRRVLSTVGLRRVPREIDAEEDSIEQAWRAAETELDAEEQAEGDRP
jgi:hypothetical protein